MEKNIVNNFGSLPAVFVSGKGASLIDIEGKKYIDFVGGIGVNVLGHNHPKLTGALQAQISRQIHISNYYNSDIALSYVKELLQATGMDRVFFGNSGAEANEAAIKLARKYGWLKTNKKNLPAAAKTSADGVKNTSDRNVIITLEKSFHGRTLASLAATGQEKFHPDCFAPYPKGFRSIKANDYAALKNAFDDSVCAFMLECIQGEGGVNLIDKDWAQAAADAARKAGAVLIADEVQTGMGRTGTLLASEQLGIEPDIVTLAKGIAGGIPMGACLYRGLLKDVFAAGDHQSTFGGNPLACAGALVVLQELRSHGFLERVMKAGEKMRNTIKSWQLPCVTQVRGQGLIIGVDIKQDASNIQAECLKKGLCVSTAGSNTIRFLPPLIIGDAELDEGLLLFKSALI